MTSLLSLLFSGFSTTVFIPSFILFKTGIDYTDDLTLPLTPAFASFDITETEAGPGGGR